MRNCLIVGTPRSGTSMLAGSLGKSGYYMGGYLFPGTAANPRGFYESPLINAINEAILANVMSVWRAGSPMHRTRLIYFQRGFGSLPRDVRVDCPRRVIWRIRRHTARQPFCFKDPRFSYTLSAWRPYVGDALRICIFREPQRTANSMLRLCDTELLLKNVSMTYESALDVWNCMYGRILDTHRRQGEWLFVHYDQVLDGSALPRIAEALNASIDAGFPTQSLNRASIDGEVPEETRRIYRELCRLAGMESGGRYDPLNSLLE